MRGSWTSWICWLINSPGISQRVELFFVSPFTGPRTQALLLLPNHIRFPRVKRTTFAVRKQPHPVLQQISPTHQVWKRSLWNVVNSLVLSHYYWNANSSQQKWKGEDHVFSCVLSILPSLITLPGGLVLWKVFMMCTLPCITHVYCAQHPLPSMATTCPYPQRKRRAASRDLLLQGP